MPRRNHDDLDRSRRLWAEHRDSNANHLPEGGSGTVSDSDEDDTPLQIQISPDLRYAVYRIPPPPPPPERNFRRIPLGRRDAQGRTPAQALFERHQAEELAQAQRQQDTEVPAALTPPTTPAPSLSYSSSSSESDEDSDAVTHHSADSVEWELHHTYFLWACRGTVPQITDYMQAHFQFHPPLTEFFIAEKLNGANALSQIFFLDQYLPGETHTRLRAEARAVLYEAGLSDSDARLGRQILDTSVIQLEPEAKGYVTPVLPEEAPAGWNREDDVFMALYLGSGPEVYRDEHAELKGSPPLPLTFIVIRMAQIPYLGITSEALLAQAVVWRDLRRQKDDELLEELVFGEA